MGKKKKSERERTGGRERLYVRLSPSLKKRIDEYSAAHGISKNEVALDAVGKYLGIDTTTEDGILGALMTQRRVTDELKQQVDILSELFLTYLEYFFMYAGAPRTVDEKKKAVEQAKTLLPKFFDRYNDSLSQGGRMPDVLRFTPGEDRSVMDKAVEEINEIAEEAGFDWEGQ